MPDQETPYLRYISPTSTATSFTDTERTVLEELNRKIAAAQSVRDLLAFYFRSLRDLCPCDRVGLAFIEEEGRRITSYCNVADYDSLLLKEGYSQDLRGSSLERVIMTGATRIIDDLEQYLAANPGSAATKLLLREGVSSNMTCPLSVDGRNIAILFRSSRKTCAYNDHHAHLHQAVAERLSQAAEKAYRIEQLEAANRAYFEMLGFVSHELKSPVASMMTDADLLRNEYLGNLNDRQKAKLASMLDKGGYLLRLVKDYLDLARLEGGRMTPQLQQIDDVARAVISPALDIVQSQAYEKSMTVDSDVPDHPVAVAADPELLKIVLVNLIGNAVKYGNNGGHVRITARQQDAGLHVSVWNEGPGFPEEQRGLLFRKFSRLQTPALLERKGTGVGLYTCWNIVHAHGGRLTARSEEGKWAEFAFTIPAAGLAQA